MAQPAVAKPPVKPTMKAGLDAVKAGPQPLTEGQVAQGVTDTQQKMAGIQTAFDKDYAAVPKVDLPTAEFHPLPAKESSELFSLMMVIAVLGGRTTHTPMTAAMNNMTGIMKGQHEKNAAMVAEQKDQFRLNFDSGMAKYKGMMEEKRNILEKYHYDMAAAQGELNTWKLQHGVADAVAKADETHADHAAKSGAAAEKLANDLKLAGIRAGATDKASKDRSITALTNKARELQAKTSNPEKKKKIQADLDADIAEINKQAGAAPESKPTASAAPPASGAIPTRPAEVPPDAKYSPSSKSWWWQVDGQWHSAKGQ